MKTPTMIIGVVLLLSISLAGCAPSATPAAELTAVTVQLKWLHQSQFAGFYAADQNGYYADEGLKVTLLEGGSEIVPMNSLLNGSADFAVVDPANLMVSRADGEPVRAIASIYRRSPLVFISNADLGITRPEDIIGKTVRVTADVVPVFHALMAKVGIGQDEYNEVSIPSNLETFSSNQAQVWGVYLNGFLLTLQNAGFQVNSIFPDDYGIHFSADTIITTDALIADDPDLVLRFVRATLKGWTYAVENPDQVSAMLLVYNPQADIELEKIKMIASLPLVNTGEDHIGWMKAENWSGMAQTLLEQEVLSAPLDVSQVYTMQFLEEIYK